MSANSNTQLIDRLRADLSPLAGNLMRHLNKNSVPVEVVEPRAPRQFSERSADHYKWHADNGATFYTVGKAYGEERIGTGMFLPGSKVDKDLQKACITRDHCRSMCLTLWPALDQLFGGPDSEFEKILQLRCPISPRIVLLFDDEIGRENRVPHHDFFYLFKDEENAFIFDPAGAQFGFDKLVYRLNEYKPYLLWGLREVDGEEELDIHEAEGGAYNQMLFDLRPLYWECARKRAMEHLAQH
ncbi:hypothetical protein P280DRAFT_483472 [Massarina eburnea CBS 473.64]|uniref:Uncharacterized protein n=1 Tax=Massarina eburnea CBS 473.64 TaxID=1395130 RepID=A0A6A6RR54_9PLEO|nr:hypothetical protein P280DRAFT_483472 [Massarina eburnea CBS 473.64]